MAITGQQMSHKSFSHLPLIYIQFKFVLFARVAIDVIIGEHFKR